MGISEEEPSSSNQLEFTKARESDFEEEFLDDTILAETLPKPTEEDGNLRRQISYELDFDEKKHVHIPQKKKSRSSTRSVASVASVGTVDFGHEYFDGISD